MVEIKEYKQYPKNYCIGSYKIPDWLTDEILQWKMDNEHSRLEAKIKSDKNISKYCFEWGIRQDDERKPWNLYRAALISCIHEYFKTFNSAKTMARKIGLYEGYNLQHYMPGQGFYSWHKENNASKDVLLRHLVFMTYLTTTPNAGTEFLYQDLRVPCEKGVTLIWPAGWTHTHRGQISLKDEKTIVTGWVGLDSKQYDFIKSRD